MQRFAVYYAPRPGAFASAAADWLGRDAETGAIASSRQPLPDLTTTPRRYGFHGTIRAPFRPAPGLGRAEISACIRALAQSQPKVTCAGLHLANLDGFLALLPTVSKPGQHQALHDLAAAVLRATNPLRAPLSEADRARRRPESLTPHQRNLLETWGYPHVLDQFRFHLTLTDRLPPDRAEQALAAAMAHFAPVLPRPFAIEDLCLFGEDAQGVFHLLERHPLPEAPPHSVDVSA